MPEVWFDIFSRICDQCGGRCCFEAHPPLSEERIQSISSCMDTSDRIEKKGYRRLRVREDGFCIMLNHTRCLINAVKPETCRAGPFTFDIREGKLEIYLKKETICPLVGHLKYFPEAYRHQYELAVEHILHLIKTLPPDELVDVLRVEEPETEKVAEILL
ncbi:MAG: YkgJ family cysteine cluster protein [Methanomicrobiales archaeon]|nr:YkgJ family cysteine cluster protein [Methanomicrobiales archaeon]